jgi:integrase
VSLPPVALLELKKWRLACPKGELDLCFPNGDGGPMDDRNFRQRFFYPALRRAKLRRVRVHDLRHTCASLLIATGADLAAISRQLGHANVNITLSTYTHWFARRTDSDLGAKLAALVRAESAGPVSVPAGGAASNTDTEVVESIMARGGIEVETYGVE